MFAGIKSFFKRGTKATVTALSSLFGGLYPRYSSGRVNDYYGYLKAGSNQVWPTYVACDLVGHTIMEIEPIIVSKAAEDREPIPEEQLGELGQLLKIPNQFETFAELLYEFAFHIKCTGNAYWVKDQPNFEGEMPARIFTLNPARVKINIDERVGVTSYDYRTEDGVVLQFGINEVIHFKRPHPRTKWYGLGEIEAAEPLFNDFVSRDEWNAKFWENGASPNGIMSTEEQITNKADLERLKAQWKDQYAGQKNSGKTAFLTGKWNYTQLGLSSRDMQYLETSKMSAEFLFALHRIPLSIGGIRDSANYATAQVEEMAFRKYACKPILKILKDTLQSDLVEGFNEDWEIIFPLTGLINVQQVAEEMGPLFDRGVVSINEVREACGLKRIEDNEVFNQHFVSAGLVPIEMAGVADQGQTEEAARGIVSRFIERTMDHPERNGRNGQIH